MVADRNLERTSVAVMVLLVPEQCMLPFNINYKAKSI